MYPLKTLRNFKLKKSYILSQNKNFYLISHKLTSLMDEELFVFYTILEY